MSRAGAAPEAGPEDLHADDEGATAAVGAKVAVADTAGAVADGKETGERGESKASLSGGQAAKDAPPTGRPKFKKEVLTTAAVVGAVLLAVPFLMARDGETQAASQSVEAPGTILDVPTPSGRPGDHKSASPSTSPSAGPSTSPSVSKVPVPAPSGAGLSDGATDKPAAHKTSAGPSAKQTPKAAPVTWTSKVVTAPSKLYAGQSWKTNRIRLTMQPDGNFVIYNEDNHATWATMTFGEGYNAWFQTDGNLVVYNADHKAVWATGTNGHDGATLVLTTDGNVCLMAGDTTLWAAHG